VGVRRRSDQFVTSSLFLPVVHAGPHDAKVVRPRGSQPHVMLGTVTPWSFTNIGPSTGEGTAPFPAQTLPRTRLLPYLVTDGFGQGRLRVYMNQAAYRGDCPAVTDGLDGFRESQILLRRVRGRTPTLPPDTGSSATQSR
jgi:hypothetical protein